MTSPVSPENAEFYELFSRCNHTELLQVARRAGFNVPPNLSRDALIRIIIYEVEPPIEPHVVDEWRWALMRFVIEHRKVLETQLTCPAKSFQEDACFACTDTQVVHCLTANGDRNFKHIQLHKKTR